MKIRLHKANNRLVPKWKKHCSSSSNPAKTKHRDAAKAQLLATIPSSTTADDIMIDTARQESDRMSRISKTTRGTSATTGKLVEVNARVLQVNEKQIVFSSDSKIFLIFFRH